MLITGPLNITLGHDAWEGKRLEHSTRQLNSCLV